MYKNQHQVAQQNTSIRLVLKKEQQRSVFEHVRSFAKRLEEIGLDDLAACRREYARYAIDGTVPEGVTVRRDSVAGVACAWFVPHNETPGRVAIHAFGGGFMLGGLESHAGLAGRLALAIRGRVLLPLYRLAPEHRFPSALADFLAVYSELARSEFDGGERKRRYYLTGDSCGGGIAIAAAIAAKNASTRLPNGIVTMGAFADLTASGDSYRECAATDPIVSRELALHCAATYLDGADPRDPRASPLFADLSDLPPLLLEASSSETLRDDSVQLAEKARRAGVPTQLELWRDMVHVWHHFAPLLPQANEAFSKIGAFIDSIDSPSNREA